MFEQGKTGSLNAAEKRIVKALIDRGWKNQDIQALVNLARPSTTNSGRISQVKGDKKQLKATDEDIESYFNFKRSFDLKTGLNPFLDERLIKSREAMKLAVSVFNNPSFYFRSENFSMLAIVAWTYLALEYCFRNSMPTERKNGSTISLADFISKADCPFSSGIINNLKALIKIRNEVEHRLLGPHDASWIGIFQACCLNYENEIKRLFGERLSLSSEISFALQFSSFSVGQANQLANAKLPERIKSINSEVFSGLNAEALEDKEFQFSVVYTMVSASKSKAAIQFISSESAEGKEFENVLVKHKPSDVTHPHKATAVVKLVRQKSGKPFNISQHTEFWKRYEVRPPGGSKSPEKTDTKYCYYNSIYKSYSYNDAWVGKICSDIE